MYIYIYLMLVHVYTGILGQREREGGQERPIMGHVCDTSGRRRAFLSEMLRASRFLLIGFYETVSRGLSPLSEKRCR